LLEVVNHYDGHFKLNLGDGDKTDLVEYLQGSGGKTWSSFPDLRRLKTSKCGGRLLGSSQSGPYSFRP
jgi:hypothetical protein